jgi:hypothetical protein
VAVIAAALLVNHDAVFGMAVDVPVKGASSRVKYCRRPAACVEDAVHLEAFSWSNGVASLE